MADFSWRIWLMHGDDGKGDFDVVVARCMEEAHEMTRCMESTRDCPSECFLVDVALDPTEWMSRVMRHRGGSRE